LCTLQAVIHMICR